MSGKDIQGSESQGEALNDDSVRADSVRADSARGADFAARYWALRDRYAQHRTSDEVRRLLNYGHAIPIGHGKTKRFVDENYPGWTWNQLVEVLKAAGVFVPRGGGTPTCDPNLAEIYFDSDRGWLVHRTNGRAIAGPAEPGSTRPRPAGVELPVLDLSTGMQLEDEQSTETNMKQPEIKLPSELERDLQGLKPSKPMQVFEFQVQDEGRTVPSFSCVASDIRSAFAQAKRAGFRNLLLMEVRDLTAQESGSEATRRVVAHPLLGPEWLPIVDAIEFMTERTRIGRFWILNTLTGLHNFDPFTSPYVQAIREDDGCLHVEIGGRSVYLDSEGVSQAGLLELLGWEVPVGEPEYDPAVEPEFDPDEMPDDDPYPPEGGLPNSYRLFPATWSPRAVAEFVLESLVIVFGLTIDDLFSMDRNFTTRVSLLIRGLYRLDNSDIFALKPGRGGVDEYDPNLKEGDIPPDGYVGEFPVPGEDGIVPGLRA